VKLGILVNTRRHLPDAVGLTRAAVAKGHEVILFTMDEGTRLLADAAYTDLSKLAGVAMSVCEHSAAQYGVRLDGLPKEIVCGSQYQNAVMSQKADRVIVL
jgi:predicted peroxiredoxin